MIKNRRLRAISYFLATIICVSSAFNVDRIVKADGEETDYGLSNPRVEYNYRETVVLGSYWLEDTNFDGKVDHTDEEVPITWQIIKKYDDGTALVLSDMIIEMKHFNDNSNAVTWENSSIRSWLNEDFYNVAFSAADKNSIIQEEISTNSNPEFNTKGGNNTKDNVFLLSIEDVMDSSCGFIDDNESHDPARKARAPFWSVWGLDMANAEGSTRWWLRSPGCDDDYSSSIDSEGAIDIAGINQHFDYCGIRPAMRINLQSSSVQIGENKKISIRKCTWDTVKFGKYNGKDLTWRVLNVDGNDAFLLSNVVLVKKAYNSDLKDITWKDCSLRAWLNGDFYNECFSDAEKEMIKDTTVINKDNPYIVPVSGGEDTNDKIYLLSVDEASEWSFGFPEMYSMSAPTRVSLDQDAQLRWWWLRSPGWSADSAAGIDSSGHICADGSEVNSNNAGVRPVLHIDLSSSAWNKWVTVISNDESEVSIDPTPTVTPTANPTVTPTANPTATPSVTPFAKSTSAPVVQTSATPTNVPAVSPNVEPSYEPTVKPTITPKDNKTSFNIKNKAKVKATAKIKIKDKDKIKEITLNGKAVKIKKNKTSFTLKLKSYKKKLKKKGKWNTLKVTDKKGNVKSIKFKTK